MVRTTETEMNAEMVKGVSAENKCCSGGSSEIIKADHRHGTRPLALFLGYGSPLILEESGLRRDFDAAAVAHLSG